MNEASHTGVSMLGENRVHRSFSEAALAPVYELNETFLESLTQAARQSSWQGSSWETSLGPTLSQLTLPARVYLARLPVCLVDVGFQDSTRWEAMTVQAERSAAAQAPQLLPTGRAVELTQMTITLAWTMARTDLAASCIVFGMPERCARAVAALGVHRIAALADRYAHETRPAWLKQPRLWHFLHASQPAPASRLPPMHVRALQRQFADLVLAPSASRSVRESSR